MYCFQRAAHRVRDVIEIFLSKTFAQFVLAALSFILSCNSIGAQGLLNNLRWNAHECVISSSISQNGKFVVFAVGTLSKDYPGKLENGSVRLMETDGELLWDIKFDGQVNKVKFSPDEHYVAVALDNRVVLLNTETGKAVCEFAQKGHQFRSLAFSRDAKLLGAGAGLPYEGTGHVFVWQVSDKSLMCKISVEHEGISALAFSSDSLNLAVGKIGSISVYNIKSNRLTQQLAPVARELHALTYSPDGEYLAAGTYKEVTLWNVKRNRLETRLQTIEDWIHDLRFSSDGKRIVGGGSAFRMGKVGGMVWLWSTENLSLMKHWKINTVCLAVGFLGTDSVVSHDLLGKANVFQY